MKESLRFTVTISAYNIEKYIERAISSVINQKFESFELLIVDDCSTDNTYNIIQKYKDIDNVKIFKTLKNTGTASGARNVAIDNAKGEYLLFLDGDDTLYDEDTLERIDNLIANNTYDIVYLGYEAVMGKGDSYQRLSNAENSTKKERLMCDVTFSVSSKCWNMNFIRNNNLKFKEGMYYEDELYSVAGNILAEKTTYGGFPIFKYFRNREGSVMTKPTIKKCSDWYRVLAEIVELYEIAKPEDRKYLLSFIKNENDCIPSRISATIQALENKENIRMMKPRKFEYVDFFSE